jgi:hypothetical protein
LVNWIVTVPALAVRLDLVNISIPLGLAAIVSAADDPPLGAAAAADEVVAAALELVVAAELVAAAVDELLLELPQAARASASTAALKNTAGDLGIRGSLLLEVLAHL